MRAWTFSVIISIVATGMLVISCGGMEPEDSVETIQESLELSEAGGYSMTDELPAFGLADLDMVDVSEALEVPEPPAEMEAMAGKLPPGPSAAIKKPAPSCPHGLLKGVWKSVKPGVGTFHGKWASASGKVVGHLKGIYGKNLAGNQVLFGKYISSDGKFKGIIKGRYGKGHFKARYFGAGGAVGQLRGVYGQVKCATAASGVKKCLPGKGMFVGKWRSYCPQCKVQCAPGFKQLPGKCFCVPVKVIPCIKGKCPKALFCDLCPPLPGCQPGKPCAAVCAPPICRKLPAKKAGPAKPAANNSAGTN